MKKKLLFYITMALFMGSIAGCGKHSESIDAQTTEEEVSTVSITDNKWTYSENKYSYFKPTLGEMDGFDETFNLNVYVQFNEDGTCTTSVNASEVEAEYAKLKTNIVNWMKDYVYANLGESRHTNEEEIDAVIVDKFGMSMDEYLASKCDTILANINLADVYQGYDNTYKYKLEDDKLYVCASNEDFSDDSYFTIEINEQTLTLNNSSNMTDLELIQSIEYPVMLSFAK